MLGVPVTAVARVADRVRTAVREGVWSSTWPSSDARVGSATVARAGAGTEWEDWEKKEGAGDAAWMGI